jgi:hypothetical protein
LVDQLVARRLAARKRPGDLSMRQAEIKRAHLTYVVPHLICARIGRSLMPSPAVSAVAGPVGVLRWDSVGRPARRSNLSTLLSILATICSRAERITTICGESGTAAFGKTSHLNFKC